MRTRRSLTGAAVLVFSLTAAACSDDSSTKPTDAATTLPGGQFCDAMGQLIVLLAPSDVPTSPAETEATFAAAAVQFQLASEAVPASIATDFAVYSAAYDEYVHYLSTVGYNLDVVFSTEEGTQLAIDTSHTLTPAIVQYTINECGLSFGEEVHEPPTT